MMTDTPAIGAKLPFLFSYRDTLFGNGFVVHVEAKNGRALSVHEEDGWWMYGVNPGGMAAHGDDPHAAHAAFRKTFSDVWLDIAKDTRSFAEFRDPGPVRSADRESALQQVGNQDRVLPLSPPHRGSSGAGGRRGLAGGGENFTDKRVGDVAPMLAHCVDDRAHRGQEPPVLRAE